MLHVGPYSVGTDYPRAIDEFVRARGCPGPARHHEIYLSDPRRTTPEKLKTILRVPVRKLPRASHRTASLLAPTADLYTKM